MLEMLLQWYRRRFSDPEAIALLVILVAGFGILFFFNGILLPLLVAIVLAYCLSAYRPIAKHWLLAFVGLKHRAGAVCRHTFADGAGRSAGCLAAGDLPDS